MAGGVGALAGMSAGLSCRSTLGAGGLPGRGGSGAEFRLEYLSARCVVGPGCCQVRHVWVGEGRWTPVGNPHSTSFTNMGPWSSQSSCYWRG